MISVTVDHGKSDIHIKGYGAELIADATFVIATMLDEFDKTGLSAEEAAKMIGSHLNEVIQALKERRTEKDKVTE